MKNYKLNWIDSTLCENYNSEQELINFYKDTLIEVTADCDSDILEWGKEAGDWYDFTAEHKFKAKNDKEAINYTKNYKFGMRDIDCFTLTGIDTKLHWTEENWNSEI